MRGYLEWMVVALAILLWIVWFCVPYVAMMAGGIAYLVLIGMVLWSVIRGGRRSRGWGAHFAAMLLVVPFIGAAVALAIN